jgi:hypothetical protein
VPRTAPEPAPADPNLSTLREEYEALRRQLLDLQHQAEHLNTRLVQWEQAQAPRGAARPDPAAPVPAPERNLGPRPGEPTPLCDLIDAMVRGADSPDLSPAGSRKADPPLRRLRRPVGRRLLWIVLTAGLVAAAGVFCRLIL